MNAHSSFDMPARIDRVVVIHDFPEPEGGAGMLAKLSAELFAGSGLPVTFFSGAADRAEPSPGIDHVGISARALLQTSALVAMRRGLRNVEARDALAAWIATNDTPGTIYYLHNWSQILSPAIFEALRPVESRLVVTCHDFFNICPNGAFVHFARSDACTFKPLGMACLASHCDRRSGVHKAWRTLRHAYLNRTAMFDRSRATFTFIHRKMQQRFVDAGFGARDLVTLPNPVEPWSRERIRAEVNTGFLFAGRISRDKGADFAARAAVLADVPLTIAGTGELEDMLAAMPGNVRLAGWCDREELTRLARSARALIVPSRLNEPFGLVIAEAAASGLPVIVSDRAYLADDVERDGCGIVVDPRQTDELAATLRWLATDDEAVARMSHAGIAHAHRMALTPDEWGQRLFDIFRRKLDASRSEVEEIGQSQTGYS